MTIFFTKKEKKNIHMIFLILISLLNCINAFYCALYFKEINVINSNFWVALIIVVVIVINLYIAYITGDYHRRKWGK